MAVYMGAGGVEWEIDPPAEGTQARERFDAQVSNGELVLMDASEPEPEPEPEPKKTPAKKAAPKGDD